jgi:hypothetical protein
MLEKMTDKQLKAEYARLGGRNGNYKRETLIERIVSHPSSSAPEGGVALAPPTPINLREMPLRVSVLPDEPPTSNAFAATMGMVVRQVASNLSEQQVLDATARHRQQGMQVRFADGCWEFWVLNAQGRKGRMDSGNMAVPMKVILERADFVASGRPLPVVNPVIVPTISPAPDMAF